MRTLSKKEKLKGHKLIKLLFDERRSIKSYPFIIIFKVIDKREYPILFGVSASKRNFKKAVDRNRIKRLVRESYRIQKNALFGDLERNEFSAAMMILYVGKSMITQNEMDSAMINAIKKIKLYLSNIER
ncbi:MAG: ribonuclease P protein component [Saprospiraceae bacterium]|nr:ribonuclease P protein component [Saprospiraceae bacterium]